MASGNMWDSHPDTPLKGDSATFIPKIIYKTNNQTCWLSCIMAYPPFKYELNSGLYDVQPQDAAFFKQQTGIHDDELLKQHILQVQAKAYEVQLSSLLTRYTSSFHCRFIAISVSFVSTSFTSGFLPCPVISKHSASSRNATGLSCSTSVAAVSLPPFSSSFFFLSFL